MKQNEQNRLEDAVALYAAEPEFNQRIAEEFMGWNKHTTYETVKNPDNPDESVSVSVSSWVDAAGQTVAGPDWSPMTNANDAIEVMRSPRWRSNWPNSVLCFGPNAKSDVIVVWEKEGGVLQQLARAPRVPTAICLVAIRSLSSPPMN